MTRNEASPHPVLGILVGHGSFPATLLKAASEIVGTSEDVVVISNEGVTGAEMEGLLDRAVEAHPDREVLVLVDVFGSSCSNVSARVRRRHPDRIAVVCGVNLPMLIRFLYYRQRQTLAELTDLMLATGRDEIRLGPD